MKLILAFIVALAIAQSAQAGASITFTIQSPFDVVRGASCPSKQRVTLGSILECRPVYVSEDVYLNGRSDALRMALEEAGVRVLRSQPSNDSQIDYVDLRVSVTSTGYGETERIRVEVRNPEGDLLYFNELVASSQRTLGSSLAQATKKMCVVRHWPCKEPASDEDAEHV